MTLKLTRVILLVLIMTFSLLTTPVFAIIDTPIISDYTVIVGQVVTVSSHGIDDATPNSEVRVFWDYVVGPEAHLMGSVIADPDGSYSVDVTIPSDVTGNHYIWVRDVATGYTAVSAPIYLSAPAIEVSPKYGAPGATISVSGNGFTQIAGTGVTVNLTTTPHTILGTTTTLADGSFSMTFSVPLAAFQGYQVVATDDYGLSASDAFKIGIIAFIINPTSGPVGTDVALTGVGFAPGPYNATFGSIRVITNGVVSVSETISDNFFVPNVALGTYDVTVKDEDENELVTTFRVTSPTPPPPPPATIESCDPTGMKKDSFDLTEDVYVNGSGYMPSTIYDMYVVNDVTWTDGMIIPSRVPGTPWVVASYIDGSMGPINVWGAPLIIGKYDIVIDVNGNGVYDDGVDARDDMDITTEGFFVIPELPFGTITTLATLVLALTFYKKRLRVYSYSSPSK